MPLFPLSFYRRTQQNFLEREKRVLFNGLATNPGSSTETVDIQQVTVRAQLESLKGVIEYHEVQVAQEFFKEIQREMRDASGDIQEQEHFKQMILQIAAEGRAIRSNAKGPYTRQDFEVGMAQYAQSSLQPTYTSLSWIMKGGQYAQDRLKVTQDQNEKRQDTIDVRIIDRYTRATELLKTVDNKSGEQTALTGLQLLDNPPLDFAGSTSRWTQEKKINITDAIGTSILPNLGNLQDLLDKKSEVAQILDFGEINRKPLSSEGKAYLKRVLGLYDSVLQKNDLLYQKRFLDELGKSPPDNRKWETEKKNLQSALEKAKQNVEELEALYDANSTPDNFKNLYKIQELVRIIEKQLEFFEDEQSTQYNLTPSLQVYAQLTDGSGNLNNSALLLDTLSGHYEKIDRLLFPPGVHAPSNRDVQAYLKALAFRPEISPIFLQEGFKYLNGVDIYGQRTGAEQQSQALTAFYTLIGSLLSSDQAGKESLITTYLTAHKDSVKAAFGEGICKQLFGKYFDTSLGNDTGLLIKAGTQAGDRMPTVQERGQYFKDQESALREKWGVDFALLHTSWKRYLIGQTGESSINLQVQNWFNNPSKPHSANESVITMLGVIAPNIKGKSEQEQTLFLKDLQGYIQRAEKLPERQAGSAREYLEAQDDSVISDFVDKYVDSLTSGDPGEMIPAAFMAYLLYKGFNSSRFGGPIKVALGALAADRFMENQYGKSFLDEAMDYVAGASKEEINNPISWLTFHNEEEVSELDIPESEMIKAGSVISDVPIEHLIAWHTEIQRIEINGTPEEKENMYQNKVFDQYLSSLPGWREVYSTDRSPNRGEKKARAAHEVLKIFFKDVSEHHRDQTSATSAPTVASGVDIITSQYLNQGQISKLSPEDKAYYRQNPLTLENLIHLTMPLAYQERALQRGSQAERDLKVFFGEFMGAAEHQLKLWGVENPWESMMEMWEKATQMGWEFAESVGNELRFRDGMGNVITVVGQTANGMWRGTMKMFNGKEEDFTTTMENLFKWAKASVNTIGQSLNMLYQGWHGKLDSPVIFDSNILKTLQNINNQSDAVTKMKEDAQKDVIVALLESQGAFESLAPVYGFIRGSDFQAFFEQNWSTSLAEQLVKIYAERINSLSEEDKQDQEKLKYTYQDVINLVAPPAYFAAHIGENMVNLAGGVTEYSLDNVQWLFNQMGWTGLSTMLEGVTPRGSAVGAISGKNKILEMMSGEIEWKKDKNSKETQIWTQEHFLTLSKIMINMNSGVMSSHFFQDPYKRDFKDLGQVRDFVDRVSIAMSKRIKNDDFQREVIEAAVKKDVDIPIKPSRYNAGSMAPPTRTIKIEGGSIFSASVVMAQYFLQQIDKVASDMNIQISGASKQALKAALYNKISTVSF